jgi:putative ABC transport system permease protein
MRLTDLLLRLRALLSPQEMDDELADELQLHMEMQTRKNLAAGLAPEEARRRARLQFGGVERVTEECRDVRGIGFVERAWRDTRYAVRGFRRTPGFTAVALLALMLGIGANTAIFSVVYAVLLAPLPYPDPDQLVMVWPKVNGHRASVSAGDYLDWKQQNRVFQDVGAWSGTNFNLSGSGRPEVVQARITSPGLLNMQGIRFFLGRDFLPEEGQTGRDHVVVMTHRLWQDRFGSDPNIIGRQIRLNHEPYTVVGVFAEGMADRFESQLIVPLALSPDQITHNRHWLLVMARMKPGVTLQQANGNMDGIARRIADAYPASNKGWGVSVEALHHDFTSRDTIKGLWLLMGAVGFVLLIACVNVANLLLARGTARQKEVAVRASLGARRGQLFSQFLTESLALAMLGGLLGVSLAWAMLRIILALLPPFSIPTEADVRLNLTVLFFSLTATLVAGVLCGCAPAWQSSRWNLSDALKDGGRTSNVAGRHGLRRSLVVVEFALALTLLAGAGLALHSFWKLANKDLGFRSDHILTFSLNVPTTRSTQSEQTSAFYRQLLDKIQVLPGVSSAAASTGRPVVGTGYGMAFSIAGKPVADRTSRPNAGFTMVTPEYFRTFGIPILKGRSFTEQDTAGALRVAIVNETFARKYLSNVDPLTQRVVVDQLVWGAKNLGPPVEWQIVGVYRDVHNDGIRGEGFPEINVPFWQSPWPNASIEMRTNGDPAGMSGSVAAAVQSVDPDLGIAEVRTMDQLVEESLGSDRFATVFLATFAAMALLLAGIGIYGVMSFAVAQRTHEIGLRMALGAARAQVLHLVLEEGISLATVGLLIGLCGTYFVGRVMKSLLYDVKTIDPATLVAVMIVLLLSALLACYIPARRATRVDPMVALRNE